MKIYKLLIAATLINNYCFIDTQRNDTNKNNIGTFTLDDSSQEHQSHQHQNTNPTIIDAQVTQFSARRCVNGLYSHLSPFDQALFEKLIQQKKDYDELQRNIEKQEAEKQYLETYGVSYEFLWGSDKIYGLYQHRDFQFVENWIKHSKELTKAQALNIWDGYSKKRVVCGQKKISGRQRIKEHYDNRDRRAAKQKATETTTTSTTSIEQPQSTIEQKTPAKEIPVQEKSEQPCNLRLITQKEILQHRLEMRGINSDQSMYLPQDFDALKNEYDFCAQLCKEMMEYDQHSEQWQQRLVALQKTIEQNYAQNWQEIFLSDQAQGYLLAHSFNPEQYQTCYGTPLQQQLHTEICTTFESIAQKQRETSVHSMLLDVATQCNDASFDCNDLEAIHLTIGLQELAKGCCILGEWAIDHGSAYMQAVKNGIVQSAHDFIKMAQHPLETIQNLGKVLWFICDTLYLADENACLNIPGQIEEQCRKRQDEIFSVIDGLVASIHEATGPQRVEMATKFTADCVFQHKAIQAIGAFAGIARSTIKSTQFVTDIIEYEPAFASASDTVTQAISELEQATGKAITEEIASQNISKCPTPKRSKIFTKEEIISKVQKQGGKISERDTELFHNAEYWTQQATRKAQTPIDSAVLEKYHNMKQLIGNSEIPMLMDVEHIINCKYQLILDKSKAFRTVELTGGHFAGTLRRLEQEKLVEIESFIKFDNGCIEYQAKDLFSGQIFTHTEFPPHWTVEKIAQETKMIFDYYVSEGINLSQGWSKSKSSSDLFKIKIVVDTEKCSKSGLIEKLKIITARPDLTI